MYGSMQDQQHVSNQLYVAFKDIGFATLVNHGMDMKLVSVRFAVFTTRIGFSVSG